MKDTHLNARPENRKKKIFLQSFATYVPAAGSFAVTHFCLFLKQNLIEGLKNYLPRCKEGDYYVFI